MRKIIIRFLNILVLSFLITSAIMITVHLVNKDVAIEFSKQDNEKYVNIKNDSL